MDQGTGVLLVFALAFLFVGWYIVGGFWQRRTANAYLRTLGLAAQQLSESTSMPRVRWLGQAGFQLTVDDAVAPFTKVAIVTLLMPREALALWLAALLRRRGDSVVVRADLREKPRADASPAATAPIREVSLSRTSPNVIAAIDPGWVRTHAPADIAAAIRTRTASR
ncbi:MAG TPA: hypothetical protein VFC31_08850 [Candidatus Limnocylindria bacterium]|nr:hypothetical protein [Candidatus Limnocylindria bacterium]